MSSVTVPTYMIPASVLATEPVEVTRAPEMRTVGEGKKEKPKVSDYFPGRIAYSLAVEVERGRKRKILLDGRSGEVPVLDEVSVTVWAESAPSVKVGQYVRLSGVMVGAVEGSTYVQALGVDAVKREGDK